MTEGKVKVFNKGILLYLARLDMDKLELYAISVHQLLETAVRSSLSLSRQKAFWQPHHLL
jgi:hypothetical protein